MTEGCLWWSGLTDYAQRRHPFSFTVIWSLYPASSGQAIPSAFGLFRIAETTYPSPYPFGTVLIVYSKAIDKFQYWQQAVPGLEEPRSLKVARLPSYLIVEGFQKPGEKSRF
jgi:hypothetical protein